MDFETLFPSSVTALPTAKYAFGAIVALLLVIAVGQWYVLGGLTELYLGVPVWLWLQLVILVAMLGLAWVAMGIWTAANDDSSTGTADGRTEW
jgi:hypothetical protein